MTSAIAEATTTTNRSVVPQTDASPSAGARSPSCSKADASCVPAAALLA